MGKQMPAALRRRAEGIRRRTQEERSASAQQKLAKAAFELIRDHGYASFRVASVARAAGVSQGGYLHHYPTKDLITFAAIEYGIEEAQKKTDANLAAYEIHDDPVDAIARDSREYYFSAAFDVAMDVTKAASPNPELRRKIARKSRSYRNHAEEGWQRILIERGWPESEAGDLVEMTTSLVRGFAIRSMIRRDKGEIDRLLQRWKTMVYQTFRCGE